MERRTFLKLLGVGVVELATGGLLSKIAQAAPETEEEKKVVLIFSLEEHLRRLKLLQQQLEPIVREHDLFVDFKGLSPAARMEDFRMYFPLYAVGELQYEIPWFLLWIIHVQETTVSTDRNSDGYYFRGAMQRWIGHGDAQAAQAASGWEFLADLEQRWTKPRYSTNDYEEILWAAEFIRKHALVRQLKARKEKRPELSWEQAVLDAQYDYCARWVAEARIRQYRLVKTYFAPLDLSLFSSTQFFDPLFFSPSFLIMAVMATS